MPFDFGLSCQRIHPSWRWGNGPSFRPGRGWPHLIGTHPSGSWMPVLVRPTSMPGRLRRAGSYRTWTMLASSTCETFLGSAWIEAPPLCSTPFDLPLPRGGHHIGRTRHEGVIPAWTRTFWNRARANSDSRAILTPALCVPPRAHRGSACSGSHSSNPCAAGIAP